MVVAGIDDGEPFVGYVNMIGIHYSDDYVVTGGYMLIIAVARK